MIDALTGSVQKVGVYCIVGAVTSEAHDALAVFFERHDLTIKFQNLRSLAKWNAPSLVAGCVVAAGVM